MLPEVMRTYAQQFGEAEPIVKLQLLYLLFVPIFLTGVVLYAVTSY